MNWYVTKLVFQIICGEGNHAVQFDEQLCLVRATNEDEGLIKAMDLGMSKEETFYNKKEELVQWKFINITEFYPLSLTDGVEVHSTIIEVDDDLNYKNLAHAKADQITRKLSQKLLQLL